MPTVPPAYKTGAAKADITDTRPGLIFAGYSYEEQESSGAVDLPLFARAFVIEENRATPRRLCLVVIDAWACPEPIKTRVLAGLPAAIKSKLDRSNLVISATHTHSAPGGYADYFLYNLTTGGQDKRLLKKIVDGIILAIKTAFAALRPGAVYVAQGDLDGCGDNRSVAAYRATPEGMAADAYERRTDRQMTVLRLTQIDGAGAEKEIGLYSLFAIHPTSIGMFNSEISGDNKGWAAKLCEDAKGAGFVAAFANANAGDVSPNVAVSTGWTTTITLPKGGPLNHGDPLQLPADKMRMHGIGKLQADKALQLISGAMVKLSGDIDARSAHVDMSSISIAGAPGRKTAKSAMGASFGSGSHEDSIAYVSFKPIIELEPKISEGTDKAAFEAGFQRAKTVIGAGDAQTLHDTESEIVLAALAIKLSVNGEFDDLKADPVARSWAFPRAAQILFPGRVEGFRPEDANGVKWFWNVPHSSNWAAAYVNSHGAKPVMFATGITEIRKTPTGAVIAQPLLPHVVQLQVVKIGALVLGAVPFEFTTVAGRRLKARLQADFGTAASHVAMVGYANDYAFYVTSAEEYATQNYEGASTVFGPHTLAACLQEMSKVAVKLRDGQTLPASAPAIPKVIYFKP